MATDYAEKERTFIASLAEETGADLGGWLRAIDTAGVTQRNDIIDWLRQKGFAFAKASWIERIHHNGGRLIYGDDEAASTEKIAVQASPSAAAPLMPFAGKPPERQSKAPPVPTDAPQFFAAASAMAASADISAVLATAKGLRPLADVLVREILNLTPGIQASTEGPLLTFSAPKPFAALLPAPKELRLYGDFGTPGAGLVKRAEPRSPAPFPQVIVLADVRQIDQALLDIITSANTRLNG